MEAAMSRPMLASSWLRVVLGVSRWSPVGIAAGLVVVAAVAAKAWLLQATDLLEREQALVVRMAALPRNEPKSAASSTNDNLALFYRSLGEPGHAERQLRTLFALADKTGIVLDKGEYREAFDSNARLTTYQLTLPVKGSYRAIRQFAMQSLREIPFASLDEISFRRDAIGDANVEARLRFTLYLRGRPPGEAR
jgi:hypothetical protein